MEAKLRHFASLMLLPFLWFTFRARMTFLIPKRIAPGLLLAIRSPPP